MSGAGGIRAGRAYVELYADGTRLEAGLKRAQERLRTFGSALRNAGASMALTGGGMFTPFVLSVKKFMDAAKDGQLAGADLGKAITLNQAIDTTSASIDRLEIAVGAALTPALVTMSEALTGVVDDFTAWARENPGTVTAIALIAGGVVSLGAGLIGLSIAVNIASWAFGSLALAATTTFGVIAGTISAVLSPIGLVAAGLTGLGYLLATKTKAGRESLSYLGQGFAKLADDGKAAWGGITDALASGDLGLAAQIGMQAVKLEFQRAWAFIKNITFGFLVGLNKAFLTVGTQIAKAWAVAMASLQSSITKAINTNPSKNGSEGGQLGVLLADIGEKAGILPAGTFQQAKLANRAEAAAVALPTDNAASRIQDDLKRRLEDINAQSSDLREALNLGLADFVAENDAAVA
jgi:hypothetical protein